jgi:long-chain acyl-CoA synthetase
MEARDASSIMGLRARLDRLRLHGHRPAYLWRDGVRWRSRSYASLHRRSLACAALLAREGVRAGTPVLIQGPDHPDWVEALLGTFLAGGAAVPLDEATGEAFRERVARRTGSLHLIAPPRLTPPPGGRKFDFGAWGEPSLPAGDLPAGDPEADGIAEIVFTSGTTGEPQGVVLTHGNIASDFASIERAFLRHESLVRSLGPMSFLATLPLSHMFGQALSVFLPLYMGLTVIFVPPRPRDVLEAARRFRPWGLFTVPRLLDLLGREVRRMLRDEGKLESTTRRQERFSRWPFYLQALLFGRVRRIFGARFRLLVVGGAPLPEEVQQFWESLGYLVVQGYGLTETAPIVSVSNPFRRRAGSVGRPLGIQEVMLGPGNEVLVRGPNVTRGYLGRDTSAPAAGWFHTGDVGEFDGEGHLRIRGRLKDMIVTAEGENVYPQDVEGTFALDPRVREACVLGIPDPAGEHVHAALLLRKGADPESVVRTANERLIPRQRVRDHTLWPEEDFPRTSTGKVRKGIVRERILSSRERAAPGMPSASAGSGEVRRLVARVARSRAQRIDAEMRLAEDLGLGSLDLVELAVALEEEFGVVLADESMSGARVSDLERTVREVTAGRSPASSGARDAPAMEKIETAWGEPLSHAGALTPGRKSPGAPRWAHRLPARLARRLLQETFYRPVVLMHARPVVTGVENLREAAPPYLFVCNHRSAMDTGLFLAALPRPLRGRIAPAMTTRHHRVYFGEVPGSPRRYAMEWLQIRLAELLIGVWPLPETAAFRQSLSFAGELMDAGISLLIFPEGRHVPEGTIASFQKGIGIFARELRSPVVPACVEGTARVLPDSARWPSFGHTRLALGGPLMVAHDADPSDTARRLEAAVRELQAGLPLL